MFRFSLKAIAIFILLTVVCSQASAFVSKRTISESVIYNDNKVDLIVYKTLNDKGDQQAIEEGDDCCQIECEDSHCICFDNMCSSVVYLSGISFNNHIALENELSFLQPFDKIIRIQSNLYRPPIVSS